MVISTTFQSAVTTETSTRCIDSPLSLVISPTSFIENIAIIGLYSYCK